MHTVRNRSADRLRSQTVLVKKHAKRRGATTASKKRLDEKVSLKSPDEFLIGWPAIAQYLGQPTAVAQRWAKSGMPVQRKGRSMTAKPDELQSWLGKEAKTGAPVHIAQSTDDDLLANLRRGLKEARSGKRSQ